MLLYLLFFRECVSCLDEFDRKETVHLECHDYCKICFESLIEYAASLLAKFHNLDAASGESAN